MKASLKNGVLIGLLFLMGNSSEQLTGLLLFKE